MGCVQPSGRRCPRRRLSQIKTLQGHGFVAFVSKPPQGFEPWTPALRILFKALPLAFVLVGTRFLVSVSAKVHCPPVSVKMRQFSAHWSTTGLPPHRQHDAATPHNSSAEQPSILSPV